MAECVVSHIRVNSQGYPQKSYIDENGRQRWANHHRYVWEKENGPLPGEMQVHHACRNKCCINLDHLEVLRIDEHRRFHNLSELGGRFKFCKSRGHDPRPDAEGRNCKECRREQKRQWRAMDAGR